MSSSDPEDRVGNPNTLVVGAGQAGLAMAYWLQQREISFRILDTASEVGAAWRARWDSLRLFTAAQYDALPGMEFPAMPDTYPGKEDVVHFLQAYAEQFDIPVELDSRVKSLTRRSEHYLAETEGESIAAQNVVVATGPFQVPRIPPFAEDLDPRVEQMHSTAYRRPAQTNQGPVLIVGGGNTGFQIAAELSQHHEVHMAIGSRQKPLPQRILGRDLFWYLERTGLIRKSTDTRLGRRLSTRETLIGSSPRSLRKRHGVELHGRATAVEGTMISFEDGDRLEPGTVIWATGFRPDYSWIKFPVTGTGGRIDHQRGVTEVPGLYFLGLTWQYTRGSALLGWVKDDAHFIAEKIATSRQPSAALAGQRS